MKLKGYEIEYKDSIFEVKKYDLGMWMGPIKCWPCNERNNRAGSMVGLEKTDKETGLVRSAFVWWKKWAGLRDL